MSIVRPSVLEVRTHFRNDLPYGTWSTRLCYGGFVMDDVTNAELARSINRIEVKLDRVTDDHEQRLRRVEKLIWTAVGLSIGSGFLSLLDIFKAQ